MAEREAEQAAADLRYPLTINGHVYLRSTGEVVLNLIARRTGEVEDGCEVYVVEADGYPGEPIPLSARAFRRGVYGMHLKQLPGKSTARFQFGGPDL